jgi:hypothetical protein
LFIAVGALDIEPGDEIIVSPWTMCASATCIIHWLAIPIFADINKDTFNLDPGDVEKKITKRTKAIILPDIFGHPADVEKFLRIKKKYNLKIITDNAQSIAAKYKKKYVGGFFDMGGFSFNHHKHINTGEGGVVVTNSKNYAEIAIKNGAEAPFIRPKDISQDTSTDLEMILHSIDFFKSEICFSDIFLGFCLKGNKSLTFFWTVVQCNCFIIIMS